MWHLPGPGDDDPGDSIRVWGGILTARAAGTTTETPFVATALLPEEI